MKQVQQALLRCQHKQGGRVQQRGKEKQRGHREAIEVEIAERFPVRLGKALGADFRRTQHGCSGAVGLGFTKVGSAAIVTAIGQNALADGLIDSTVSTLNHALGFEFLDRFSSTSVCRPRLSPNPPDKPHQPD